MQLAIIFAIVSLTIVFIFLGKEMYRILGEFRLSVHKMNKMLDDMGLITESISKPIANASGFLQGLKSGVGFVNSFINRGKDSKGKGEDGGSK